jgi:hypothetical protein
MEKLHQYCFIIVNKQELSLTTCHSALAPELLFEALRLLSADVSPAFADRPSPSWRLDRMQTASSLP